MSMLDVGKRCTACHTVDFLPSVCPHCHDIFCSAHIRNHPGCITIGVEGEVEQNAIAGPSSFQERNKCPVKGCERLTIEAIGGVSTSERGAEAEQDIAREVRCPGCGKAFCSSHRQRSQHGCVAPTDHTDRQDAFLKRKAAAAEIIAKNFPEHAGKVIPKPPPQRDVERVKPPSPKRLPPSLQPPVALPTTAAEAPPVVKPVGKSKGEKLHDIHLRKLRSLATPLLAGTSGTRDNEKRFFEWCTGSSEKLRGWLDSGKVAGTPERVWVPQVTPVGRILDRLIHISKMLSHASDGPSETINLFCLPAPPDAPRCVFPLENSKPAGEVIPEGAIVCLVKGESGI